MRHGAWYGRCTFDCGVKSLAGVFVLAVALAQQRAAFAADSFRAVLLAPNEPAAPETGDPGRVAFFAVHGPFVTFILRLDGIDRRSDVHLHRGKAISGDIVAAFGSNVAGGRMMVGEGTAADIVANPQNYFVDAHTPDSPERAYVGQLKPFPYPTPPPRGPVPLGGVAPAPARGIGAFDTPAPQPTLALEILPSGPKAEQSINFRKPPVAYYRDPDFPLYATATSGLSVGFTATGDCSLYGSYVHVISAGRCTVTAHQPGDSSRFSAASDVDQVIPISKATQSISFGPLGPKKFLDPAFGLYASASSGLSVVFQAAGDCRVSGSTVQLVAAGTCWVTAHQPGDSNFTAARIVDQQFEIAKGDQTITFTPLPPPDWWGATFVLQATASSGLPVVFTAKGVCVVAGDGGILQYVDYGTCAVTADQPGNANINPAPGVSQTFTIDAPPKK